MISKVTAGEKLKVYMSDNDIPQVALAKWVGISQPTLSRYIEGKTDITVMKACKIEAATGGYVAIHDWAV